MPGGFAGRNAFNSFSRDREGLGRTVPKGTVRRIVAFGRSYAAILAFYLSVVVLDAAIGIVNPLIYREIIDVGILQSETGLIIKLALLAGGIALLDALLTFIQRAI